jgi:hypothetical protein
MPETQFEVTLPDGRTAIVTALAVNPSQLPQAPPGSGLEPQVSTRMGPMETPNGPVGMIYFSNELSDQTSPTRDAAIAFELGAFAQGRTDDRVV